MTDIDFDALAAPFAPDDVEWRLGRKGKGNRGMALAFIDARAVMNRLDKVVGPANWGATYSHAETKTICELSIYCNDQWVTKANGAGDTDYEGEKGASSDAFKRAAVLWGIGRYLYDLDTPWVELDQHGKRIKKSEMPKLHELLGTNPADMPAINIIDTSKYGDFVVDHEDSDEFIDGVASIIYSAQSTADLEALYRANLARFKKMQNEDADTWAVLHNNFAEKKSEFVNGKAAA